MSLIVTAHVPTGIVMSADSRTTIVTQNLIQNPPGHVVSQPNQTVIQSPLVLSDATRKLFRMYGKYGVSACGLALINGMPIAHHLELFELSNQNISSTQDLATKLLVYFGQLAVAADIWLHVCGYDNSSPTVFVVGVQAKTSIQYNFNNGRPTYGLRWNGDTDIVNRITGGGTAHIAYDALNVQDAVDLSRHLIRTTIDQMRFEIKFPSVGGPIDTLLLTSNSAEFLSAKKIVCQ